MRVKPIEPVTRTAGEEPGAQSPCSNPVAGHMFIFATVFTTCSMW